MNMKDVVDGPRTFMSVSIFETLIESLKDAPGGISVIGKEEFKTAAIMLKIGAVEIPFDEVLQQCNATAARSFGAAVAERVKEVIFSEKLDAIKRQVDEACEKIDSYTRDLNFTVGRLIEEELGPNAGWSESSGSC